MPRTGSLACDGTGGRRWLGGRTDCLMPAGGAPAFLKGPA